LSYSSGDSEKKASSTEEDDPEKIRAVAETEALPIVHASVKASCNASSSSPSESSSYFVSQEDLVAAAAKLGASGAKLIGGNIVGVGYFNKRTDTVVAFSQEYSRVSYPLRNVCIFSRIQIHPRTHTG
jgi:hypothetical protein